jgi:hypothetical protein
MSDIDKSTRINADGWELDQLKFMLDALNRIAVRVANDPQAPLNVKSARLIQGVDYDAINATYPTATSEVYTYKKGVDTVQTVTVTYTDNDKRDISSVVFT